MLALIAARARNNVIGRDGRIPWHIPGEQAQFRQLTEGNTVIMGRRSYEEIAHPLPRRMTIVVSSTKQFVGEKLITVSSLPQALAAAGDGDVFVAGGEGLFREALPLADVLYITEVDTEVEGGDTFFPDFPREEFVMSVGESGGGSIRYTRTVYTRIKKKQ